MRCMNLFLTSLGVVAVAACETPYNLTISNFDEEGPQTAAAIEISDPQIYTRENLINDRRVELTHLNSLLKKSENAKFVPQLRRDLREISAFTASLRAAFNPALGAAAGRAEDRAALEQEVALADLQTQLAKARERRIIAERRVNAVSTGDAAEGTSPSAPSVATGDTTKAPKPPDLSDIQKRLDKLTTRIDKVLSDQAKVDATTIPSTPGEQFRDQQAYRAEIRAAIAESNLDDLHDVGGNALYRLQFRATVLPGERKGQFGIAQMRIAPPELSAADLEDLYFAWLGHVTYQLNSPLAGGGTGNWRYETLGASARLYDVVYFPIPTDAAGQGCKNAQDQPTQTKDCKPLRLAVLPPFGVGVQALIDDAASLAKLNAELTGLSAATDRVYADLKTKKIVPAPITDKCPTKLDQGWVKNWFAQASSRDPDTVVGKLVTLQRFMPVLASSIRSLQTIIPRVGGSAASVVQQLLLRLNRMNVMAQGVLTPLELAFPGCNKFQVERLQAELRSDVPRPFLLATVGVEKLTEGGRYEPLEKSTIYTYAAKPVELAQQVSTAASAGNALELSLALSATVPQSGVSAEGAAGYMRAAIGRMEALERAPIVVGFASSKDVPLATNDGSSERQPSFGWVFGPAVVPDTEDNALERRQRVVNHQVFADVSVPGWWPRMRLNIETAWIANWYKGGKGAIAGEDKRPRSVTVDLPRNRANFESLTETVARVVWGRQPGITQIFDVEPRAVYLCPGQSVRFLVYGSDVWRNATVFLNGTKANDNSVRILPDMSGITAQFDLAKVAPVADQQGNSVLTVWTQNGSDSFREIRLLAPTTETPCPKPASS